MCGIAGVVDMQGGGVARALLEQLCSRLVHRGPDEEGYYLNGHVGLAQRRLSVIDLAGGHQPLANEDASVWVTFNGEIYNFRELRGQLEALGHRFATHSDTEVIVHAYEQYGPQAVTRLRGMFAFALWDQKTRTLVLARDRVGKKPLFYAVADDQLVFASELQALLRHPGLRREPDWSALDDFLTYGYVPAPRTGFRSICKLPPAHYLVLETGEGRFRTSHPRLERYWQLDYVPKVHIREEDAAEGFVEVLTEAIRLRLIADVPLGAMLSGGIDSGLVVALMSELSGGPVRTFSVGFEEQHFNELPFARLVAQRYGTDHHEFVVRPNALEVLPTLVRHYGEPFADSSAVPSYYLAKMIRQHVKVALNGDGGDECFAGYDRYRVSALAGRYRRLPHWLRQGVLEPLASLIPDALPHRNRLRRAKRLLEEAGLPMAQQYLGWVSYLTPAHKRHLYTPAFHESLTREARPEWLLGQFAAAGRTDLGALDTLLAVDVESYLPYDLLVKMDIATMANSLEDRSPFLDHKVMEFAAALPEHCKLWGRTTKRLLRKLAARYLPAASWDRPKMGFSMPVGRWMRGELRPLLDEVLLSPRALGRGYFQEPALRRIVQEHVEGAEDHKGRLWTLLWLELWHREFIDG